MVILSRSFCNTKTIQDANQIAEIFSSGVKDIRRVEKEAQNFTAKQFQNNQKDVKESVKKILEKMEGNQ